MYFYSWTCQLFCVLDPWSLQGYSLSTSLFQHIFRKILLYLLNKLYTLSLYASVSVIYGVDCHMINSAIHKAADQAFSRLKWPPGAVPAASSIHGLWEFQELYQAKSWNGREPWGQQLCE